MLLSTIEAYLSGKKELFKGLAIEKLEQKWEEHPILYLDLNTENYKEPYSLRRRLDRITEEQVSGDLLNSIDSMSRNPFTKADI